MRPAIGWFCPLRPELVSTTKPGRLSASDPSPYHAHDPMLGRPEMVEPVFMNVWAGSWLIASVTIERTMQISSAIPPRCGKSDENCCPDLPNRSNLLCGSRHLSCCPCSC